jgi:CheY-like chemotaxis protein/uncharacterized Zn-finger protein
MTMGLKKEAVEVKCGRCDTDFRLWIPEEYLEQWGEGEEISCIKCGARYQIKKGKKGFKVSLLKEKKEEAPKEAPKEPPKEAPAEGKETVLLVEEDKLATAVAESSLSDVGIKLITAKNGKDALKKIEKGRIDLLVTDLHLKSAGDPESDIDGEDLLRMVADKGTNIPSIVTTGKDIVEDMVHDPKWLDLQVKGFIQKGNPFWAEKLRDKIKEVLNKL